MNRHIELLRLYNQWRRGDIEYLDFTAKEIGEAIDGVLEERAEMLEALEYLRVTREDKVDQRFVDEVIAKAKGEQ